MSGVMEIPTLSNLDVISVPAKEKIVKKSGVLPGIATEIVDCLEEAEAIEIFHEVYIRVNLPISVRTKEDMEKGIKDLYEGKQRITEDNAIN